MSNADIRGRFIWHELMTTDPDAAGAFYSKVVPWKTQPSGMPSYTLWVAGKTQTGGLMALPQDVQSSGTPPHWLVYVGTPDVDATVAAAQRLGAKVLKAPSDIPNIGRFAVLSDPQGATFAVYTPAGSVDGAGAGSGAPGEFSWHELATTDPDAALQFYTDLFGWQKGPSHDMGAMGVYQLFEHRGAQVGGIYKAQGPSTPPHWLSYVRVADADKAAAAAKAAGGRVVHGPVEVPGGSWIVMLMDPQGGEFAVHEPAAVVSEPKPAMPKKPPAAAKPKPAAEPAKPATAAAQPQPAPPQTPAAVAGKKAKKAPARKPGAAKRKAARPAGKKAAAKKRPAKRAAARKSTAAKRGKSVAKKRPAAGKRIAAKSAAGKSKKRR